MMRMSYRKRDFHVATMVDRTVDESKCSGNGERIMRVSTLKSGCYHCLNMKLNPNVLLARVNSSIDCFSLDPECGPSTSFFPTAVAYLICSVTARRPSNMFVETGKIEGEKLGRTLTHEHLYMNYDMMYVPPPEKLAKFLEGEITLRNVGFVQRYPYSSKFNLTLTTKTGRRAVAKDLETFKSLGGGAIVENSNHGLNRDANILMELSKRTGVHIIAGTGYYLASVQSESVLKLSKKDIFDVMMKEMIEGCPEARMKVKCGFMGEIGSNYPICDFEKRVIQAVGELQQVLKCPVSFHPGRNVKAPYEIMRIYSESGGDTRKAVMSHLDRTFKSREEFLEFASEYECYLQQDLFGTEVLLYQLGPEFQMPSDAQRIETVKTLIENGYHERILLSHDIHTKQRLIEFGGHGYSHIFTNVAYKMLDKGISQKLIDHITIQNPINWLSWKCSL